MGERKKQKGGKKHNKSQKKSCPFKLNTIQMAGKTTEEKRKKERLMAEGGHCCKTSRRAEDLSSYLQGTGKGRKKVTTFNNDDSVLLLPPFSGGWGTNPRTLIRKNLSK